MATVPGEGFGTGDHIRVSYATSKENLDRGLERMRKFFALAVKCVEPAHRDTESHRIR